MTPEKALQATLAAEHAAVHLLAVLGGVTSASSAPSLHALVSARHARHRERREHLLVTLRNLGADPVAARPSYAYPEDLSGPGPVRTAGRDVEDRCAQAYAALVASSTDEIRAWATSSLTESSVSLLDWRGAPEPFPGAPEL